MVKSVLMALIQKKPVALSVGSINIDQRVVENASVEDKNNNPTYKILHSNKEEVRFYEKVKRNYILSTIDDTGENRSNSSKVSSCEQAEIDAPSSTVGDNTERRKSSVVSSRKQVQTPPMVLQGI